MILLQSCSGGRIGNFLESSFNDLEEISKNENESENRSLKKEDDIFTVDIERALEILALPKMGRGGQEVLKDFGKPKEFKEKIQILNGRYGVYLKCGKTNVSIAKDTDIEKITIDDAVSLLEEKLKDKKGSILKKTKIINKKTKNKS